MSDAALITVLYKRLISQFHFSGAEQQQQSDPAWQAYYAQYYGQYQQPAAGGAAAPGGAPGAPQAAAPAAGQPAAAPAGQAAPGGAGNPSKSRSYILILVFSVISKSESVCERHRPQVHVLDSNIERVYVPSVSTSHWYN